MPDMLNSGLAQLTQWLQQHAARSVVYRRGTGQVMLKATIGRTLLKFDDGYGGVKMQWTERDFLLPTAALVLAGQPALPLPGDRIEDAGDTYEVLAPGGEPCWRYADPFHHMLRIHTKQIAGT